MTQVQDKGATLRNFRISAVGLGATPVQIMEAPFDVRWMEIATSADVSVLFFQNNLPVDALNFAAGTAAGGVLLREINLGANRLRLLKGTILTVSSAIGVGTLGAISINIGG